jgi:endonuclease G
MAYDPNFIPGVSIALPALGARTLPSAFAGGAPIEHTRFSIVFNEQRGFALFTAHNIDGASLIPEGEIDRDDRFRNDPSLPRELQVDNDRGYTNNPWDRGHLVRRRSMHWGDRQLAELTDQESYFWTNIAPQHTRLHHSAWGLIEDWMMEVTDDQDKQACIFTGPVFTPEDPEIVNRPGEEPIRIPAGFWKIFAIKHESRLRAASFLVWQRDFDRPEPLDFDPVLEQVRLTTVEYLTGLSFGELRSADPLRFGSTLAPAAGPAAAPGAEPAVAGPAATPSGVARGARRKDVAGPMDIIL